MLKRSWPAIALLALASAVMLCMPESALARGGRGGGGGGGRGGWGGGRGGWGGGGYGYRGGYYGRGWDGSWGWGLAGVGLGYALGSRGWDGYGYSSYDYYPSYSYPYVEATPYYGDIGSTQYIMPSTSYEAMPGMSYESAYTPAAPSSPNAVNVTVEVPQSDAQVWFDDQKTTQTGMVRHFESPPLDSGATYQYHVRARWTDNGKPMERDKTITVHAGDRPVVDFRQAGSDRDAFRKSEEMRTAPRTTDERPAPRAKEERRTTTEERATPRKTEDHSTAPADRSRTDNKNKNDNNKNKIDDNNKNKNDNNKNKNDNNKNDNENK